MNKFSSLKIMRRHWRYEAEHVIYCTPEMEPGSLSGSLFTQALSSVQGPGGVVPCSQAADKKGNSKSELIVQSVLLLLSPVHLNCAAAAKGFPRDYKTRLFWLRSYRKDAHLHLSYV